MSKKYLPLILIILLAAVLRLVALGTSPAGFNSDEAALGYNAYSLGLTGRDEHGHFLPVNLESFGDFKPALYSYLLVPLVKFFGLNEFVVRLPSAVFGVFAVGLIYYLTLQITGNRRLSAFASLFLAISPWHLHFSRGAWEVNVATSLILVGMVSFLRWKARSGLSHLVILALTFTLSMYTYQSARVIAPLLGLGLFFVFHRQFFSRLKQFSLFLLLLILLLVPLGWSLISSDAASRAGGVGLLADEGPLNFVKELRGQHSSLTSIAGKIFHNRPVIYSLQFVKNYLSHFDGNFLFVNGDMIERNKVPESGLLYWPDAALLLFGLAFFVRKLRRPETKIVILWLIVAPIASALTFQVPHALRAQNLIIPLSIILGAGMVQILDWIKSVNSGYLKLGCFLFLILGYGYVFSRYLHQYYIHYPQFYPTAWQYGFKELAAYVEDNQDRYTEILVTDKYDQPYVQFLFFMKYPPGQFQGNHQLTFRDRYNFSTVDRFSKYRFLSTSWDQVRDRHSSLIIAAPDDIPEVGVNIVKTIYFPGGQPAFKIVSN